MPSAFKHHKDLEDVLRLLARFRGNEAAPSSWLSDLLWVQVPVGGIPALSGPHPGTPGKALCGVFQSVGDDSTPVQVKDVFGNHEQTWIYHYGPSPIPELDHNDNPRMIFAAWQRGRPTAIVDYCPPSS